MKRLLALIPLLAVAPALGQSGSALKGHDSAAPVDVGADRIEVQDRANRAIFSGNVQARQGNMTLSSSRLTVVYANGDDVQIQRLEATGGVTLRTPTETARSQYAIYDLPRGIVTMIGGVNLDQGSNHVQGGRLVLDLDTHRAVLDGGGRVTGRFTVPRRQGN
ncbi:MAG: OstA family protein [Alphaproteobacteria bacterium]|jgi:lipopolysaccharide export system protein LptA|nr:MAG: OstA family protein [Alphaproteobacteria bacterium]